MPPALASPRETTLQRPPWAEARVGPNLVAVLKDGYQAYPAMLAAIEAARRTICLESYILLDDEVGLRFLGALMGRARAGVEVLVMYDAWGSVLSAQTLEQLAEAGVKVLAYRPLRFGDPISRLFAKLKRRNHRKSLTVDGVVGFTGGLNIGNDYAAVVDGGAGWRDTHLRIEGPDAQALERLFLKTWKEQRGPRIDDARFVRPRVAGCEKLRVVGNDFALDRKGIRRAYEAAFDRASARIYLTHAYFLPPSKMLKGLMRAAQRGVHVAVILAATTDVKIVLYAARGLYPRLIKNGVQVYEWRAGHVLHAKTAVVDGTWSTIGSSNLDALSLRQNLEVNALITEPVLCQALERLFVEDLSHCERVTLADVKAYGLVQRVLSWLAFRVRHWL